MKHLPKVPEIMTKLEGLHRKQADLMQSLNKSLHIKSLWPDAFANGSRVTMRIGTHTCYEWDQFLAGRFEIDTAYLMRMDDGETFPLTPAQFRELHFMPGGKS